MGKENLMLEFPHKPGDTLPNGIKVSVVCMGDANDTFGGYRCREILKKIDDIPEYGREIVCKTLDEAATIGLHEHPLEVVGPVPFGYPKVIGDDGYPKGAKIWFRVEGEKADRFCTPTEFLQIAKQKKIVTDAEVVDTSVEEAERETAKDTIEETTCQGETKKGKPCKRPAMSGEIYCSSHIEE